jgi:hypothetical protein
VKIGGFFADDLGFIVDSLERARAQREVVS